MNKTQQMRRVTAVLTLEEVAERCRLRSEQVRWFVQRGLIEPVESTPDLFAPHVTVRIQKIVRLRRDLNVNYDGIALVLDLLERIDRLEARLQTMGVDSTTS